MNKLALNSYAKLNLFLEVLNKRKDNFHNIKTIFERIDLSDKIILKVRADKRIKISCKNPLVPLDSSNLCYRSAKLLQDKFRIKQGVQIQIIKRIPVAAGLGGGSSNAAAVLGGLNKLWGLNLSFSRLISFAKTIGCDIPFFIFNTSFALGSGRGDNVKPLKQLSRLRLWQVLVVPKIKVSTPRIYQKWDQVSCLTRAKYDVKIITSALLKKDFSLGPHFLFNGLEQVTLELYPEVKRIREKLAGLGIKIILMSGSGPAVFGLVTSRKEAVSLKKKLQDAGSWRVFAVRTI